LLLLFVAVNVSVWAAAIYFHRIPGVAAPPMKTAPPPYNPGVTLTEILVTDLRGEKPLEYRANGYPPPFDSVPRYRTLRRKTISPPGALFHVRFSYGDGTTNEIALLRETERLIILCGDERSLNGDERNATNEDIVDFLDSAWAMDICADLRSYDPDEFARGMARREELGDKLTEELCDQLTRPEVFGGHAEPRLRLLLRPTQGVPLQIGPSLFGFNPKGDQRAELIRDALLDQLQACYSLRPELRESRVNSQVGPICDLLFWLMNAESDDHLTEMLATTTAPSWNLLDLSRRRASMPAVEAPSLDCITGMTDAEIAAASQRLQENVDGQVREWLTLRKELTAMTAEARLEYTINAWDAYLGANWERFSDSIWGTNLREDAWSRIVSLGPPAAPLARQRERDCVGLLDRAFWHSITVYLGDEIDYKLIARLIKERESPDTVYSSYRQFAKLILQAGNVTDIPAKYPELANIYHSPLDGRAAR
jgi:hypothetical protein